MPPDRLARRRRLRAMLGLSALIAALCAAINSGAIGIFPPKLKPHNLQIGVATAYVDVDPPTSMPALVYGRATPPLDIQTFANRGDLLGRIMVSSPVLERIAPRCGVPPDKLSGLARMTANVPISFTQPGSEQRASDIEASLAPYRLEVQSRQTLPIIDVYAEAPSVAGAQCLANTAPVALTEYLQNLARQRGQPGQVVHLQTLGPARGGVANAGATLTIAVLTFVTVFVLSLVSLVGLGRLRRRRLASGRAQPAETVDAQGFPPALADDASDSWPHTKRPLPWMLAGFLALLWLTPFNNIALKASLPIELRLDRLVLPFVAIAWLLAVAARGRSAPRFRLTWIHVALGALLAFAFLSVVTDARYLNQALELSLSFKKLPLLVSYVLLFVIVASALRPSEVRPFMTYTLVLAVICGLGMIYEYRMKSNVFWNLSQSLFGHIFEITGVQKGNAVDAVGRRVVRGPAEVPLEAVAMLTMALPIALVRILNARRWRQRILYALAVCVLVAATFATYRKSALIAPVAVVLALAYFRRRELLKLAPLGLVLLVLVTVVSPGAIRSTVDQFTRADATEVSTVSDRTSDYDAIRPDVWTHLLLGRGWGSYNHDSYRILDSEILSRTIEIGVLGLVAFLLVPLSVVGSARKSIASRDPASGDVALIGACVAVAFLVLTALFDELSFPHAAYIFLYMAGLQAVVLPRRRRLSKPPPIPDRSVGFNEPELPPLIVAQGTLVPHR